MKSRKKFNYEDTDLVSDKKLELHREFETLSLIHANHAKELMASVFFDPKVFPTITDPALSEALIHAQLSTTYAILKTNRKGE